MTRWHGSSSSNRPALVDSSVWPGMGRGGSVSGNPLSQFGQIQSCTLEWGWQARKQYSHFYLGRGPVIEGHSSEQQLKVIIILKYILIKAICFCQNLHNKILLRCVFVCMPILISRRLLNKPAWVTVWHALSQAILSYYYLWTRGIWWDIPEWCTSPELWLLEQRQPAALHLISDYVVIVGWTLDPRDSMHTTQCASIKFYGFSVSVAGPDLIMVLVWFQF